MVKIMITAMIVLDGENHNVLIIIFDGENDNDSL